MTMTILKSFAITIITWIQCCKGSGGALFGLEKGGAALRGPHFLEGKGGPGAPWRVRPTPVTVSDMYFYCVFDRNSIANSIRMVHSVKKCRLRRASNARFLLVSRKNRLRWALIILKVLSQKFPGSYYSQIFFSKFSYLLLSQQLGSGHRPDFLAS